MGAMEIKEIVSKAGGPVKLGKEINLSHSAISCWSHVPVRHARRVSELTDIPLHVLRPDIWKKTEGVVLSAAPERAA
jgi:Putative antitoxin of bacterial toxin-antitoxin system, YdaS/YdaT